MCSREAPGVLLANRAHSRMFRPIIGILDVNVSCLADVAHGDILTIGAECILLAAGA